MSIELIMTAITYRQVDSWKEEVKRREADDKRLASELDDAKNSLEVHINILISSGITTQRSTHTNTQTRAHEYLHK